MVAELGGRARFVEENYGDSALARRFGVTRYPAVFVNDVLVATPKDFGFYGPGEGAAGGRYAPLHSAASHERFRRDLRHVIDLVLAGRAGEARASVHPAPVGDVARLPVAALPPDLDGHALGVRALGGRYVLVEVWATWCPPCRSTLEWLARLQSAHPRDLVVITAAVDSDADAVRRVRQEIGGELRWTLATPELGRALGDVTAVPTLYLFGPDGQTRLVRFGATPDLHAAVERVLAPARAPRVR